jgi:hypothetical protein
MAFPLKAKYLKTGDRIYFGNTKWAKIWPENEDNPWGHFAGMRRTDDGKLRVCFLLGGVKEMNFKVEVDYDQYFQVERPKSE